MATRGQHGTLRPISDLWDGVSVSGSDVGGARRGQGGVGGGAVRRRQLGQTLRGRGPLRKTGVVLEEEYCSTVYCPVVHLVSESTQSTPSITVHLLPKTQYCL